MSKTRVPLGVSRRARIWVVTKVINALVSDGVFEVLNYVMTKLAGEIFHVEIVK